MPKRLGPEEIADIARRLETGAKISRREMRAVCELALEMFKSAPSLETVRLAMMLVSSRGALPLKSAQAEALGVAVMKAAQASLLEAAARGICDAQSALELGRNWIEGLQQLPPAGKLGPRLPGLARSMTKTMYKHLSTTADVLNYGMPGVIESFDMADPGYREIPAFEAIPRRESGTRLELAHDALRVARLGIVKLARFTHMLAREGEARTWDDALAKRSALLNDDLKAHLAALAEFLAGSGEGIRG